MVVLGGSFLELHKIVSVAFKEFPFLLVQRAPSQKQPCVYFNLHTNTCSLESSGATGLSDTGAQG